MIVSSVQSIRFRYIDSDSDSQRMRRLATVILIGGSGNLALNLSIVIKPKKGSRRSDSPVKAV